MDLLKRGRLNCQNKQVDLNNGKKSLSKNKNFSDNKENIPYLFSKVQVNRIEMRLDGTSLNDKAVTKFTGLVQPKRRHSFNNETNKLKVEEPKIQRRSGGGNLSRISETEESRTRISKRESSCSDKLTEEIINQNIFQPIKHIKQPTDKIYQEFIKKSEELKNVPLSLRINIRTLPLTSNLEDYKVLGEIGKGQFGTVHKVCLKEYPEIILCWKRLNYSKMPEKEKKQLQQEIQVMSSLDNPHVIKCAGRINDRENALLYLIMEYCEDGDLGLFLEMTIKRGFPIPERQIIIYFSQLILALDYCHNRCQKVFHRDLKPQNIMLCDNYKKIKIGDFGLAKMLNPAQSMAQTHVGTPYYMSPELLSHSKYNAKSDIWALGCLMYELATGRPPYLHAKSFDHLRRLVLTENIPPLNSSYSDDFERLVMSMLVKDVNNRPSSSDLKRHPLFQLGRISDLQNDVHVYSQYANITKEYKDLEIELLKRSQNEKIHLKDIEIKRLMKQLEKKKF